METNQEDKGQGMGKVIIDLPGKRVLLLVNNKGNHKGSPEEISFNIYYAA
jgi:hypothetical protein